MAVDGKVLDTPAVRVRPGQRVTVDGKPLPGAEATRLFRYHKPPGVVTAARDPEGRPTIFDALPEGLPRLMPVGRLDISSEGLLLLTNDGELSARLELPATGWLRRYRARAFGMVDERQLAALAQGVTVDGIAYGPIRGDGSSGQQGGNAWLDVALREGKNREVRRVLEHLGLKVNRLIRVAYGPFQLGDLPKRRGRGGPAQGAARAARRARRRPGRRRTAPAPQGAGVSLRIIAGRHRGRRSRRRRAWRPGPPASARARRCSTSWSTASRRCAAARSSTCSPAAAPRPGGAVAGCRRGAVRRPGRRRDGRSRANLEALGEAERAAVLRADACRLGPAPHPFDIVFLDPPYGSGLLAPALASLADQGWLAPGARIAGEVAAREPFVPVAGFVVEDDRSYGAARLLFLRREAHEASSS